MTTDNETKLTGFEKTLLELIAANKFKDDEDEPEWNGIKGHEYTTLWNKGLIARRYEKTYVTDLGKHVLLSPATPPVATVSGGGDSMCEWCGVNPAVHNGECEDCWRLPGHDGMNAEPLYIVKLRARIAAVESENASLREVIRAAHNDLTEGIYEAENNPRYTLEMAAFLMSGIRDGLEASGQPEAEEGT